MVRIIEGVIFFSIINRLKINSFYPNIEEALYKLVNRKLSKVKINFKEAIDPRWAL